MDKTTAILVPFNFSRTSKKALHYAVQFIRRNKRMKLILGNITDSYNINSILPRKHRKKTSHQKGILPNCERHIQK